MRSTTSIGICVHIHNTEKMRQWLIFHNVIDTTLKFSRTETHITIPVNISYDKLMTLLSSFSYNFSYKIDTCNFEIKKRAPNSLEEVLLEHLDSSLHAFIPKSFDTIGDIVVIDIPDELLSHQKLIGQSILELFPSIKTVYRKASPVTGQLRIRELEFLAGKKKCQTIHKEYDVRIFVDVCKTYFSPRLSYEHHRISNLVGSNEKIVDLFTGVGSFPLHIAAEHYSTIYAIDINRHAIKCLNRSLQLNKLKGHINPILGDCRSVVQKIPKADRVLMNLPGHSDNFVDVACSLFKKHSVLHFYQFVPAENPKKHLLDILEPKMAENGWKIKKLLNFQKIRTSAPYEIHACVDVCVESNT